ncbi:DUF3775 domain-containing protein [Nostoc sp. KVJ3]|uniref:DUF3775 domain-containing protein n=1 Tax=Nostoc sp. KVJ3 TaxID=457945 RepID=UPI002237D583|nr:DUF3775 domain-containing protein [Nostoc sp. KVJ3]MCW5316199.1 DUF3775 domain-containing protein [Nostoc sp. KVJ3]
MNLLVINKIYKIIETAELIYFPLGDKKTNQSETFVDKLSNYLEDFQITGRCSVNILQKYINEFSQEEKAEVIALMWLGRGASSEQPENFTNLLTLAVELIPQNYATSYIIEKPLLAKYLRDGLQKLDTWTSSFS